MRSSSISTPRRRRKSRRMGFFLDGRVSLVVGTHTHIPTSDHRILKGGTALMADAGMCGDYDSIIGVDADEPLNRFLTGIAAGPLHAGRRRGDALRRRHRDRSGDTGLAVEGSRRCGSAACWRRRARVSPGARTHAGARPDRARLPVVLMQRACAWERIASCPVELQSRSTLGRSLEEYFACTERPGAARRGRKTNPAASACARSCARPAIGRGHEAAPSQLATDDVVQDASPTQSAQKVAFVAGQHRRASRWQTPHGVGTSRCRDRNGTRRVIAHAELDRTLRSDASQLTSARLHL